MGELRLRVQDFMDAEHWRWLLTDDRGVFLADHQVAVDTTESEYEGFADLAGFLRARAVPDQRLASETALVQRVGGWIGERVLGEQVGRAIVDHSPVVVRVELPVDADVLLYRPLELAHVDGLPLAVQDVSLIFEVDGEVRGAAKQPIAERLRMLAVFSLPTGGTALALRRERYSLTRLVRRIAGSYGRAIELHVLQYGVTRQRLREALRDGRGWDVVHFSGHGLADGLVLERPDGTGDLVRTPELVALLRPARQRLKLVCLSSCLSAAGTAAEARRVLSLDVPEDLEDEARRAAMQAPLPGLARELVRRLDCAVLAMRYSVVDDFAIALDEQLYEGLLGQDQELTRAVQLALAEAAGDEPTVGAPAISVATPALFGPLAANLSLSPPPGEPSFNVGTSKVAYFPDEPERFVGRAGVMARASTALAPQNQQQLNTVLFYGMAGAGKTACALELAYRHEQAFGGLVWWKAPEQGHDITTSLRDMAVALETQLPGFKMVHAVSKAELGRFLPRLTQLLEDQAILLVLDNLESLLTDQGGWRDPNWGLLVEALVGHRGNSRLVLTSRVAPVGLDGRVLVEPVHALSLDESLLLARELPNLGRLLRQDQAGSRGQDWTEAGLALVRRVLNVVQGHPKLLELADAQAADPVALRDRLADADQALPGQSGRLEAFFARGESELAPEQFLETLAGWTRGAVGMLPEGARALVAVLCALEESDRTKPILQATWPQIWQRLGHKGDPPPLAGTVAVLERQALVEAEHHPGGQGRGSQVVYRVHPGMAEAVRAQAGQDLQAAVDAELADFWQAVYWQARAADGGEASGLVVRAGSAAAPYMLRLGQWAAASQLLEHALNRDRSPAMVAALLPLLGQLAQATRGTDQELPVAGLLARAVSWRDPAEGERQLRAVLAKAVVQQAYDQASTTAGDLVTLLLLTGRPRPALALVDDLEGYVRQAGLGPWTQLLVRGQRLQLLEMLGKNQRVLAEVQQLRGQLSSLPETGDQEERVQPWNVREAILQAGALAARELGHWEAALELNSEVTRSKVARGAPALDQARARFNDYPPLLELGRLEEARALLHGCREVFQAEGAILELGGAFGALADLENRLGHQQDAISFQQAALRYRYAAGDADNVTVSHNNLANSLRRVGDDPALVVAHRLAAALLRYQTGAGRLAATLQMLAGELAEFGDQVIPGSFEELAGRVGRMEGVRLAELLASLPGPAADGDEALAGVLRLVREQPGPVDAGPGLLERWEPMIDAAAAAARGDPQAAEALEPLLAELDKVSDWAALAMVLRRVLAGERGEELLDGLDETDTAIVAEVLRRLQS